MSDSTTFAYALAQVEGVGRVTAARLFKQFPTYDSLLAYPREQVLLRIKSTPNAAAVVSRLFDEAAMRKLLQQADDAVTSLAERRVALVTLHDAGWPERVDDLPQAHRPYLLYAYGEARMLQRPLVSFFARPPLPGPPFEQAQALARHLIRQDIHPATGAAHGFDVVMHKLASDAESPVASVMVTNAGLMQLSKPMRPIASTIVRTGGLLLSSFPMQHGPYDHDDRERALLMAALADACVFVAPQPDTPEWEALSWALDAGRPVFGIAAAETPLPERVHPLAGPVDHDWVVAAAGRTPS